MLYFSNVTSVRGEARVRSLMSAALALLLLPATGWAQAAGGFLADARTHCRVWWPARPPDADADTAYAAQSAKWNGPCRNGLAEGRGTFEVATTSRFMNDPPRSETWTGEGDFAGGRLGGRGFMVSTRGVRAEGEFAGGALNGRGFITVTDSTSFSRTEGEFRDGKLNGWGKIERGAIDRKGFFTRYEGEWRDGRQQGKGVFVSGKVGCNAQMRYEGEFQDGRMMGRGTLTTLEGRTQTAVFTLGQVDDVVPFKDDFDKVCR